MPATKTKRTLLRATPAKGARGVDREAGVIRGYAVATKGKALGRDYELDEESLAQIVTLGNHRKQGVKSRFGHPAMSSDALGTYLGRARNFRLDGNVVRADLHMDPSAHSTPNGDLAGYVMDLAESDPKAFGSSIVFESDKPFVPLDAKGKPEKDASGNVKKFARLKSLFASDVVDEPAANRGGFLAADFFTGDVELSARALEFLDRLLESPDGPEKLTGFLDRYLEMRGTQSTKGVPGMGHDTDTDTAALEKARQEGAEAERKRIASIREAALSGQESLVEKAIAEGWSEERAMKELLMDAKAKNAERLSELRTDSVPPLGQGRPDSLRRESPPADLEEAEALSEEQLRKHWDALSKNDRSEWLDDFEAWSGYQKNRKNIRIQNVPTTD